MPSPYIEPPYRVPGTAASPVHAIRPVGAISGAAPIAALPSDLVHTDTIAERYSAALSAVAESWPHDGAQPAARPTIAEREASGTSVILQHDRLSLHPPAESSNPFEGLIEHVLHVHLPHDEAIATDWPPAATEP